MKQAPKYFKRPEIAEDAVPSPVLIHPVVRHDPFKLSEELSKLTKEEWDEARETAAEISRRIQENIKRQIDEACKGAGVEGKPSASNVNPMTFIKHPLGA